MGNSGSKDVGSMVGNAIAAPFKSLFGHSCQDTCSGIWDVGCFIEHLCILDLVKLVLISGLCYVCLIFVYLLFKLGLCQCVVKSLCKMCWVACETYWLTLDYICCFCWYKIRHTKRVYRGRRRRRQQRWQRSSGDDVELGHASSSASSDEEGRYCDLDLDSVGEGVQGYDQSSRLHRKRKSWRGDLSRRRISRKNVKLKAAQVYVRLKSKSRRGRSIRLKQLHKPSLGRGRRHRSAKFKRVRLDDI